ncbi:MAG: DUF5723 family protein [Capnocytophaga sp.]|nr:DUF5723 family protein [Capnocytophaga sp.]
MKRVLFFVTAFASLGVAAQQSFSGVNTSQYGGMYKVINNPANIVDGINRFAFNALSVDGYFGNNKMGLTTNLTKSFNDFTTNITAQNDINADVNLDVLGPSFYFHVGRKNAFAFTSRVRALVDVRGVDAKVIQAFMSGTGDLNLTNNGYNLSIDKQYAVANAFSEFAFSWARLISKSEHHSYKVGITAKIVRGAISTHAGFSEINGNIAANVTERNGEAYLDVTVGTGETSEFLFSNGGVSLAKNLTVGDALKSHATGLGFDIGFVYEYRKEGCPSCTLAPYDFKLGISLTDLGRLKYTVNEDSYKYTLNPGVYQINLSNIQESISQNVAAVQTPLHGTTFTSSLPAALRLNGDARVIGPLFVDVAAYVNLANASKTYNAAYSSGFTITPRAEWKYAGVYLPFSTTKGAGTNVGVALRLGPLFVGSRSIVSNLISKNAKELNVFAGLQFEI